MFGILHSRIDKNSQCHFLRGHFLRKYWDGVGILSAGWSGTRKSSLVGVDGCNSSSKSVEGGGVT